MSTYGTLSRIASWVCDMVTRKLDRARVEGSQELAGKGKFVHFQLFIDILALAGNELEMRSFVTP